MSTTGNFSLCLWLNSSLLHLSPLYTLSPSHFNESYAPASPSIPDSLRDRGQYFPLNRVKRAVATFSVSTTESETFNYPIKKKMILMEPPGKRIQARVKKWCFKGIRIFYNLHALSLVHVLLLSRKLHSVCVLVPQVGVRLGTTLAAQEHWLSSFLNLDLQ